MGELEREREDINGQVQSNCFDFDNGTSELDMTRHLLAKLVACGNLISPFLESSFSEFHNVSFVDNCDTLSLIG